MVIASHSLRKLHWTGFWCTQIHLVSGNFHVSEYHTGYVYLCPTTMGCGTCVADPTARIAVAASADSRASVASNGSGEPTYHGDLDDCMVALSRVYVVSVYCDDGLAHD